MSAETILLVDDEPDLRRSLKELLEGDGYRLDVAENAQTALDRLQHRAYPVILTDLFMPGGLSGLDLIQAVKAVAPRCLCIMLTGHASQAAAVEALKRGAYDFVEKPIRLEALEACLDRALEHARLLRQVEEYHLDLEARVLARTEDLRIFHEEVLALNNLLLDALGQRDEKALLAAFLVFLRRRFAPAAGAVLLLEEGPSWRLARGFGKRPKAALSLLPQLEDRNRLRPSVAKDPSWQEWGAAWGYPDGFLVDLAYRGVQRGAVFVGFTSRAAFHPQDPTFDLWKRQLEAALYVRSGNHGLKSERS